MWWEVNATPRLLYTRERPGTHCVAGWVGFENNFKKMGTEFPIQNMSPEICISFPRDHISRDMRVSAAKTVYCILSMHFQFVFASWGNLK